MKEINIWLAAVCAGVLLISGCGTNKKNPEKPIEMINSQTVQSVVDQIAEKIGMQMPADINDAILRELYHVKVNDLEDYAGKISMEADNREQIVVVKVKPDRKKKVFRKFEQRLSEVQALQSAQTEENGLIWQVADYGNYIFFLVLDDSLESTETDLNDALQLIADCFPEAAK